MRFSHVAWWLRLAAAALPLTLLLEAVGSADESTSLADTGRRIFEQGILADGSPLRAVRPEGIVLEGRYAACAVCHRRSGMGTIEGSLEDTILVPPIVGRLLFAPALFHGTYYDRRSPLGPERRLGEGP